MRQASQASSAQSYMYLSVFALLCQYDRSPESRILRERSRVLGQRSNWPTPNREGQGLRASQKGLSGMLARWYLLLFADGFGAYATKQVLKRLGGRGSSGSRIRSRASSRSARKSKMSSSTRPTQLELPLSVPRTSSARESTILLKNVASTDAPKRAEPGRNWPPTFSCELYSELVTVHTSNMRPTSQRPRASRFTVNSWLETEKD